MSTSPVPRGRGRGRPSNRGRLPLRERTLSEESDQEERRPTREAERSEESDQDEEESVREGLQRLLHAQEGQGGYRWKFSLKLGEDEPIEERMRIADWR